MLQNIVYLGHMPQLMSMAQRIVVDEERIKEKFLHHNAELADKTIKSAKKELLTKQKRLEELSRLIQVAFIRNIKKDLKASELTREMCYELLDRGIIGGRPYTISMPCLPFFLFPQ